MQPPHEEKFGSALFKLGIYICSTFGAGYLCYQITGSNLLSGLAAFAVLIATALAIEK